MEVRVGNSPHTMVDRTCWLSDALVTLHKAYAVMHPEAITLFCGWFALHVLVRNVERLIYIVILPISIIYPTNPKYYHLKVRNEDSTVVVPDPLLHAYVPQYRAVLHHVLIDVRSRYYCQIGAMVGSNKSCMRVC